jgi:hypothetical protein
MGLEHGTVVTMFGMATITIISTISSSTITTSITALSQWAGGQAITTMVTADTGAGG